MPSFTSSSDTRAPEGPYIRQWLLTLVLVAGLIVAFELSYRAMGHLPSVTDSMVLWAQQRSQVYPRDGERSIVLVGSSRIQLDVVPEILEQKLPGYRVTHLAIDGTSGFAVLKDLAEDPNFAGLVIYDAFEETLLEQGSMGQQAWVDYYHQEWSHLGRLDKLANLRIQVFLQERFAIFSSALGISQLLKYQLRVPPYLIATQPDRYRAAYYFDKLSPEELARQRERRLGSVADTIPATEQKLAEFRTFLDSSFKPAVKRLQQREGNVLFLHPPVSPERMALYKISFPRDPYWNQIEHVTGAPTLHFQDVPEMRALPVPDSSHLDAADARTFSALLADELLKLGLVSIEKEGIVAESR